MSKILTYVEIDVPAFTQTSPDSPETELTLRFAKDVDYLPLDINAIPSILDVQIQPAIVSLGQDLGQRANISITFRDHRHVFDGEDFDSGTFWGKFRARYGLTLQGNPLRLIRGMVGQELSDMETRHYFIDSTDGPNNSGEYKLVAKDVLTFANGVKAQAPVLSNGRLLANINNTAISLTVTPSGIGSEYPASGYIAVGGSEIMQFARAADVFSITRGHFNTTAVSHDAGDAVQLCLEFSAVSASSIINTLLTTYSDIDSDFIPFSEWETETTAYLNTLYTALIASPVGVNQLVSEIIEQASLVLFWDDVDQKIRLQVLKQIPTSAFLYDQSNTLQGTLDVQEQPEKRLSDVQVLFAKINPLIQDDEDNNYRSTARVTDDLAIVEYGSTAIKKIRSRWIPVGGRTTAEIAANKQLGRFRDPPRRMKFAVMRDQLVDPALGAGYQLEGTPFQDLTGAAEVVPVQITSLETRDDYFGIEAEEMLWTPFGTDIDPGTRTIIFDSEILNVNLRDVHDDLYPTPQAGDIVNVYVQAGITVGSSLSQFPALDIGTWPVGVTINLTVNGRIQGAGGRGATGATANAGGWVTPGENGDMGGTALLTTRAINLTSTNGQIWGGGGGGGGGGGFIVIGSQAIAGSGGGGGAGTHGGPGGGGGTASGPVAHNGEDGFAGSDQTGGAGGPSPLGQPAGGTGGGPGLSGSAGGAQTSGGVVIASAGGTGGAPGNAIDGDSFVTDVGAPGDIRGPQIN